MTTSKSKYTHIIWDWNGTLMDDAWLTNEIMNGMLSQRGLPLIAPEHYAEIFDFPVIDYYQRAGWDFSKIPFETLSDEFIDEYTRRIVECPLRPAAEETLERVTASGLTQSVLSAAKQSLVDQLVDHYQVTSHFSSVSGINDHHAAGKVEMARRWLSGSGKNPGEMLMVGDTVHDLHVAEALGVDCILIFSGHMSRSRLESTGARVISNLEELEF